MRQSGEIQINTDNAVSSSGIGEGLKTLKYNEKKAKYEYVVPAHQQSATTAPPGARVLQPNVRYRAVRKASNIVTSAEPDMDTSSPTILGNLENFGSKVWSVLGLPNSADSGSELPPGLSSYGRNLCFLNSVLQCIARAPNLADELAEQVKSCRAQDPCRLALLDAVSEVLQQINVMHNEKSGSIVNTSTLCQAGMLALFV